MPSTAIPFEEITPKGGGLKVARDGSASATRVFKVSGPNSLGFMSYLLTGDLGFPLAYPGLPGMRVDEVTRENYTDKATAASFGTYTDAANHLAVREEVEITVTYKPFPIPSAGDSADLPSGTWAEYKTRAAGARRSIPKTQLTWATDGKPVIGEDVEDSLYLVESEHVVTWHNVPNPPWSAIANCEGCINANEWRIPGTPQYVFAGTMLFMGATTSLKLDLNSSNNKRSLEYSFRSRHWRVGQLGSGNVKNTAGSYPGTVYGWQYIIRPDAADGIKLDRPVRPNGSYLYSTANFATLFQFEAFP